MRVPVLPLLLSSAWLLVGCDPEGPGAIGKVSLAPGVDPGRFETLAIRIFPDTRADFEPRAKPLPSAFERALDEALRPTSSASVSPPPLAFPFSYEVGEVIGATQDPDWRMVAWLSRERGAPSAIVPGDVFCTVRFQIGSCGGFVRGYCEHTRGVDCTIDQVAK